MSVLMITGASRGIGAATARLAAAEGYRLALVARDTEALSGLVEELGEGTALALPCDITDYTSLTEAVTSTERRYGSLDAVLANAGMSVPTSFLGTDGAEPDQWRDMVLTNVYGMAITARAALPALVRSRGHLAMTGSNAGRGIRPGNLYSATKWAVTGMAQNIRAECVGTGVRVTLVQPGMVETDMTADRPDVPKLRAEDIARGILYAFAQPSTVDVNEITIRPTGQAPHS
ncbi:SDR family oxidoreductase [Saccharopolyspora rhizosphaerae]|uniref:SDR family oxidoreductase n=1 Tax=Saccharopolyspora rhizosphaerae TaxID=2492662 RepID=A0A3R8P7K6_9PSEU|nr:SDR family oxidoreductase [Saccharopolyspora rhizosphaerae]RRO18063.1 SDR family oxidoreductase [Saccharopolyspora rhizosphaerae]